MLSATANWQIIFWHCEIPSFDKCNPLNANAICTRNATWFSSAIFTRSSPKIANYKNERNDMSESRATTATATGRETKSNTIWACVAMVPSCMRSEAVRRRHRVVNDYNQPSSIYIWRKKREEHFHNNAANEEQTKNSRIQPMFRRMSSA